MAVFDYL